MKPNYLLFFICGLISFEITAQDYSAYTALSYADIDSLAAVSYQKANFKSCLLYTQAARAKAEADFGTEDSIYAEYTNNVGFFYNQLGQYNKAIPLFKESISLRKKIFGIEHADYANTLNSMAYSYEKIGDYEAALAAYIQVKDIRRTSLGEEHPEFASSLLTLGNFHKERGSYNKSLLLIKEAIKIYKEAVGLEHPSYANSLNHLAVIYQEKGNYEEALPLCIESKNIREKVYGLEHPEYANSLNNLAKIYYDMGNHDKVLPLIIQSNDIKGKKLGIKHPEYARSLSNLAFVYKKTGNLKKALALYLDAKSINEDAFDAEHQSFARLFGNIGALYLQMEDYEKALSFCIKSKDITEKVFGTEHPQFALSLNNLAGVYDKMGRFEKSLPLITKTAELRKKKLGDKHPSYARALTNLAICHRALGNYDQAWEKGLIGLQVCSGLRLSTSITNEWADSLLNAPFTAYSHTKGTITILDMFFDLLQQDPTVENILGKQIILTDLVAKILTKLRTSVSNEKDKLRLLTLSNDWLQKSLSVLDEKEHALKAFDLMDQNKSVLLLQATKSEAAYRLGALPDSLVWKDKKLLKKQSRLQAKLLEKRSKPEKKKLLDELNHVNQDLGDFISMLKKQYPKYHELKYQEKETKVTEIQALLDQKTAVLEYVVSDSMVHLFLVTKTDLKWFKQPIPATELKSNIKDLHGVLSNYKLLIEKENRSYQTYRELAFWFYENLVADALNEIKGLENLVIVTDAELGHLPFEAFLVEQPPQSLTNYKDLHYLVNDFNISYNYSAGLWKENAEATIPKNNNQILAMAANYEIKLDSNRMDIRLPTDKWTRSGLSPLPAARKEVEGLEKAFDGFFAFDNLASERVIKEKASDYAVIHLAMHGLLDSKRPVLSSLAFTEDSDSIESNFWQAHEISKMQLNANLVVLSACETGYGTFEKGNGIASLARSFMYAGASSLIVSLWQVNDFATSQVMKNLYNNLADGMKKDEALRQAKLQYINSVGGSLAHPAFWSPFIQIGNTATVQIYRKGSGRNWKFAFGGLLVLVGGGILWSRKRSS